MGSSILQYHSIKTSERRFFGTMKLTGTLMLLSRLSRIRPIQVHGNITPVFLSKLEEAFAEEHGVLLRQPDSFVIPVQETSHW